MWEFDKVLVLQGAAGCGLALIAMLITFGLVRLAANLVIMLVLLSGFGGIVYNVATGEWTGWLEILLLSSAVGVVSALLCLPALPFSSFYKKD